MKRKLFLITIAVSSVLVICDPCAANEKAERIIRDYDEAFVKNEQKGLNEAWNIIKDDPQAIKHIEENYKHQYLLLNYLKINKRIDDLKDSYSRRAAGLSPSKRTKRSTSLKPPAIRLRAEPVSDTSTRSSKTGKSSNIDRTKNQNRPSRSNSRIKRTNADTARSFSNQSRVRSQSNQRRLRRR